MPTPEKSSGRRGSKSAADTRVASSSQSSDLGTGTTGTPSAATGGSTNGPQGTSGSDYQSGGTTQAAGFGDTPQAAGMGETQTGQTGQGGLGSGIRQFVRDTTYEQLGSQKQRATEGLGSIAQAIRSTSQQLRDSGQEKTADYVTRAADQLESWSNTLNQRDLEDLLQEVQRFARRQPALFIGTAFGVGLLAARFLKSSGSAGTSAYGQEFGREGRDYGTSGLASPASSSYSGATSGYGGSSGYTGPSDYSGAGTSSASSGGVSESSGSTGGGLSGSTSPFGS